MEANTIIEQSVLQEINFGNWFGGDLRHWPIVMVGENEDFSTWTLSWLYCALICEGFHESPGRFPFVRGAFLQLVGAQHWNDCVRTIREVISSGDDRFAGISPNSPSMHWDADVQEGMCISAMELNPNCFQQLFSALQEVVNVDALRTSFRNIDSSAPQARSRRIRSSTSLSTTTTTTAPAINTAPVSSTITTPSSTRVVVTRSGRISRPTQVICESRAQNNVLFATLIMREIENNVKHGQVRILNIFNTTFFMELVNHF